MSAERFKYRAFISYSHSDTAVATWLHKALESYDDNLEFEAELDRLNNLLALNRIRRCQAIIEAGGICDPTTGISAR